MICKEEMKVFVLGLDGATFDVLDPLINEGLLPNIKRLKEKCAQGILRSTHPPLTGTAWVSYSTGKNPESLGIYDFLVRERDSYKFRPFYFVKKSNYKRMWDILSDNNKKVCVVNHPTEYAARKINGILIAGLLAAIDESSGIIKEENRSQLLAYPSKILGELDKVVNGYYINFKKLSNSPLCEVLDELFTLTKKRTDATLYLLENYDWDFFNVTLLCLDHLGHILWKYLWQESSTEIGKRLRKFWTFLDSQIGKILDRLPANTNVFIISDHGFGGQNKLFAINDWLIKKGYLKLKSGDFKKRAKIAKILKVLKIYSLLQKLYSKLPAHNRKYLRRPHPSLEEADVDWSKTTAYCHHFGQIYINLRGREPRGLVRQEDYNHVVTQIKEDLSKITFPGTKKRLVTHMYTSKEIYGGASDAPDISVYLDDLWCAPLTTLGHSPLMQKMDLVGTHRMEGIFLAYGPNIKRKMLKNTNLIDVGPTILSLYNLELKNVDGKIINICKNVSSKRVSQSAVNKDSKSHTFSDREERLIKDRLKKLGYFK